MINQTTTARELEPRVLAVLSDGKTRSWAQLLTAVGFTRSDVRLARAVAQLERHGELVVEGRGAGRGYRAPRRGERS